MEQISDQALNGFEVEQARVDVSMLRIGDIFDRPLFDGAARVLLMPDESLSESMLRVLMSTGISVFTPVDPLAGSEAHAGAEPAEGDEAAEDQTGVVAQETGPVDADADADAVDPEQVARRERRAAWERRRLVLHVRAALRRMAEELVQLRQPRWNRLSRRVESTGSPAPEVAWRELLGSECAAGQSEADGASIEVWNDSARLLGRVFDRLGDGEVVSTGSLCMLVSSWMEQAGSSGGRLPNSAIMTAQQNPEGESMSEARARRSACVGALCVAAAHRLGWSVEDIRAAGLAGVLADVGMTLVVPGLEHVARPLSDEEFNAMRRHPGTSVAMIERLVWSDPQERLPESVALAVYQHHEREDASGYPQRIPAEQIHDIARLIGACDCLVGLLAQRADRPGVEPARAMAEIVRGAGAGKLAPFAVNVLLEMLGAFPAGSRVRLSTGEVALVVPRVAGSEQVHPLRPVVQLRGPAGGDRELTIDLSTIDPRSASVVSLLAA